MNTAYQSGRGEDFAILNFTVAIDNRENLPWRFTGYRCDSPHQHKALIIPTQVKHLKTGDYSIVGYEDQVTIERKSLADIYSTLGQNRDRFIRELERMREFQFAALVIEANWTTLCCSPPAYSGLHPKTVFRSLIAFAQRYGVHVYPCCTPTLAERVAFRILDRFWRDHQTGGFFDNGSTDQNARAKVG